MPARPIAGIVGGIIAVALLWASRTCMYPASLILYIAAFLVVAVPVMLLPRQTRGIAPLGIATLAAVVLTSLTISTYPLLWAFIYFGLGLTAGGASSRQGLLWMILGAIILFIGLVLLILLTPTILACGALIQFPG